MIKYAIDGEYDGVRLDRFVRKKLKNTSLTEIFKMLRTGKIKVNGKKKKENYRLNLSDEIQIYMPDEEIKIEEEKFFELSEADRLDLKKYIAYEDENLFICNKPHNIAIHRGTGQKKNLLDMYRSFYKSQDINFVNRIDKETAGLVIAAKNIKTARLLSEYIRENKIIKKYFILVNGNIKEKEFEIISYLKKDEDKVVYSEKFLENYKESKSFFRVLKTNQKYSILEAELHTGRTHQLRVQLAAKKNYIVGDKKYGIISNGVMFLFSHYIKIEDLGIELNIDIPSHFIDFFNYGGGKR